jgi:basic membrane protein A
MYHSKLLLVALFLSACVHNIAALGNRTVIGWAFIVQPDGFSWTYSHEKAKGELMAAYPNTIHKWTYLPITPANTCDAPCRAHFENFVASDEFDLIISAGTGTAPFIDQVADTFPATKFLQSTTLPATIPNNLGLNFGNIEQVRYLNGWLAGKLTQNKKIGYMREVNAIYTVRQLNAYYMGVYDACPDCSFYHLNAAYINDKENDRKATQQLLERSGADIMSFHTLFAEAGRVACSMGVKPQGYASDLRKLVPTAVSSAKFEWTASYAHWIDSVLHKTWAAQNYMGDLKMGGVSLGSVDPTLPASLKASLAAKVKQVTEAGNDKLFCGPLVADRNPDADGCITRSQFLTISTILGGIDLGNANLSQPFTATLNPQCWTPPDHCADTPASEPAQCCGCIYPTINISNPVVNQACSDSTYPTNTGYATGTGAYSTRVKITYSDQVTGVCPKTIVRTWTATDRWGYTATTTQTINAVGAPSCSASVSVVGRGGAWTENGVRKEVYDVKVQNTGVQGIASIKVDLVPNGLTVSSNNWNMQRQGSSNTWSLSVWNPLAPGSTTTTSGFVGEGAGSLTASVNTITCSA